MQMFDLSGKVAIVTGGNGGIGLGMARGLAGAGAAITVAARNEAKSAAVVKELESLGARAIAVTVDVAGGADGYPSCSRAAIQARSRGNSCSGSMVCSLENSCHSMGTPHARS